jgi:hypothetical protein
MSENTPILRSLIQVTIHFISSEVKLVACLPCYGQLSGFDRNLSKMERASHLKVPKCEIFHLFDFNDFYGIKSL